MKFESEDSYREWLVRGLRKRLSDSLVVLDSKNVNDIVICTEPPSGPRVLFIEVKYEKESAGRIGIGDGCGNGFQPEILIRRPKYFELYTRWLVAADDGWAVLVECAQVREHAVGATVSQGKQNNISDSIFEDDRCFRIEESIERVARWAESTT